MPLCFCQKLLHVGGDNTVFCQRAHHVDFGLYADVPFVPVGAQVKGGAAVEAIAVASASGVGRGASYLLQVLRIIIEVGGRACHNVVRPYGEGVFYGVQLQMDRERDFPV
ncbi:MAG TPA: hypothetical protein PKZ96_02855, partial [Bacteroides xylanisolvens]|nr:hypothetical protein [Bacteroides xylanisolvens]